jgi:hypothetical protein
MSVIVHHPRITREQIRTLAEIEPRLVQPDDTEDESQGWQITFNEVGVMRVRDVERDFHIARDGSQPWG